MKQLSVKNLSMKLGEKILLNKLNFTVEENKSLVIVGESGSGKTLLSKLLIGEKPYSAVIEGDIKVGDRSIFDYTQKDWERLRGRKIAYIAQNPQGLFNEMQTIGAHGDELIQGVLGVDKKESREKFIEALSDFNLEEPEKLVKEYPFELSGGMLQRVMIAMSMVLKPDLLIADEPTSALDSYNAKCVVDFLNICKTKHTQLVVVTHSYSLVKAIADKVLIMKRGDQIEFGDVDTVLTHPTTEYGRVLMTPRLYKRHHCDENEKEEV